MEFEQATILFWIVFPFLFIISAYFIAVFLYIVKVKKELIEINTKLIKKISDIDKKMERSLTEIDTKLADKLKKERIEEEKNREKQLQKLKNGIEEMLHQVNK